MSETVDTLKLLQELEAIDLREGRILDDLLQDGARLEHLVEASEGRSRIVTVDDLRALAEGLGSLETLINDLKERMVRAEAAATSQTSSAGASNGAGPTVDALALTIRENDAEADRLRAQLRERLLALGAKSPAGGAEKPADPSQAHAGLARTFRLTKPPISGDDVKAFQHVLNRRFEVWGIKKRIGEDGAYGQETRHAARQVALGLGLAPADYAHGITPALRSVIRTPSRRTAQQVEAARGRRQWLGKLRKAHAAARPHAVARPRTTHAPAPVHASHDLATAIRAGGGRYEDIIIGEAQRSKVPVSLVCAVIEQETDFRNVFGHDRVANPIKSPPNGLLEVTEALYRKYLQHRKLGQGNQGVGPMQLTFPGFQDRADELGGCWRPEANIRVGVEVLARNIAKLGATRGVQAYNGAPGNGYATSVLTLERKWRSLLGHAHASAGPKAPAHTAAPASPPTSGDKAQTLPQVLHRGAKSDAARALQAATKRRLIMRHLEDLAKTVEEDGVVGRKTMAAVTSAAWVLGAQRVTLNQMNSSGTIPVGIQRMIRNPGLRTDEQKALAKRRVAHMLVQRKKRVRAVAKAGTARQRVVDLAKQAAANYQHDPGAYHYLAGGTANTVFLKPTPHGWRSDCSQFVASVYKAAGLPSPANVDHQLASTFSMVKKGRVTHSPRPGDLGMYGSLGAPHHVELYCGEPGQEFIGHGSPPIDSRTPGRPDYYLTYDFLD